MLCHVSGHTILCVDDDPHVRQLISRILHFAGHRCDCAADVHEARRLLAMYPYSVVLCDIGLPGESGLELLTDIARRRSVAAVMVTGQDDPRSADTALELGAYGYVTKPFATNDLLITIAGAIRRNKVEEARSAALDRAYATIAASEADLRRAYAETVARLGRAMEFHDVETGAHVERVGASAHAIAVELALPAVAAERIRLVSPLHDIGKIAISERILRKPGALTDNERREMERHTDVGHELLARSGNELLELAATVAWTHHERWDGTGYPRGLAGDEIPLPGRIVAVADVFDALTNDRSYRAAWTRTDALAYLQLERGDAFDRAVVEAFAHTLKQSRHLVAA
jgi:putative two-component system response regulator